MLRPDRFAVSSFIISTVLLAASAASYGQVRIQNPLLPQFPPKLCFFCDYSVSVTVSGLNAVLEGALVVEDDGTSVLTITTNGTFTLADQQSGSGIYSVTVNTQPPGENCTPNPNNSSGSIGFTNVTVSIECVVTNPTDVIDCDVNGCFSEAQLLSNICRAIKSEVVGCAAIVGGIVANGFGEARTKYDPPEERMDQAILTNIASVSKTLTAIGVLRSLARHHLSIGDKIWPYIYPQWILGPNVKLITFRDLLTHTSGLPHDCGSDDYFGIKAQIMSGVNRSDVGTYPASYSNCGFALFRELLPIMEGQVYQCREALLNPCPSFDEGQAQWSATFYVNYMNENVFQPIGIPARSCTPGPSSMLSYPAPPITGPGEGTDWGGWFLTCGAGGWNVSVRDVFNVTYYLVHGNLLLTDKEKSQMYENCLGWDCSVRPDCPDPYICKNGHLLGTDEIWTYAGILRCSVPVAVVVNSPLPTTYETGNDIIGLVADALLNATVTPADPPPPCPNPLPFGDRVRNAYGEPK